MLSVIVATGTAIEILLRTGSPQSPSTATVGWVERSETDHLHPLSKRSPVPESAN
jgi:hypothetical protein